MARGAQRLQGESALGDIYSGAQGPDGSFDPGKIATPDNLRRAGVMAPQLAQSGQALAQGQNVIDGQKMENARSFMKLADSKLYPLLSEPDETLHGKIMDSIHDLIGHENSVLKGGMFTPEMGLGLLQRTPPNGQQPLPRRRQRLLRRIHPAWSGALEVADQWQVGVSARQATRFSPDENADLSW